MRFGLFLSCERIHPPEHYEDSSLHEEKVREAVHAARLGYDIVWVPEHHLLHYTQCPSPLILAAVIGRTIDIPVGTMVILLTYRHPLITAGEVALADNLLNGRLEVGVGRGAYEYEFDRLGIPFSEGRDRFLEALDILEQVWHSEESAVSYQGRFYNFQDAYIWPRPARRPHPPLWIAAMSLQMIEWAAQRGYHVAHWPFAKGIEQVAEVSNVFHAARQENRALRGDQRLGIMRAAFAADTKSKAAARIYELILDHRIANRLHSFTQTADTRAYVRPDPIDDEPDESQLYENLIVGTPEQCLEKVERYHELGIDDLLLFFDFGPPHEAVLESMEVFAQGVIAPYRKRHAGEQTESASP